MDTLTRLSLSLTGCRQALAIHRAARVKHDDETDKDEIIKIKVSECAQTPERLALALHLGVPGVGVKWGRSRVYITEVLAENGFLETLMWARKHGAPWTADCCAAAAENGHLDCLKFCRANGCPWDMWTCIRASKGGHLNTLKWSRENGCKWHQDVAVYAAIHAIEGRPELREYAESNGCALPLELRGHFEQGEIGPLKWNLWNSHLFDLSLGDDSF